MATTTAQLIITSTDLVSDSLSLSAISTLTTAGSATGITQTTGLARTNTTYASAAVIQSTTLYRADDATANASNKVYIKNLSTTAAQFYTVYIDQEEMGRLYAGDWAFFPWCATTGAKETFILTIGGTVAAGDSWNFDGVTTTSADATLANFAALINSQFFPNWTTTVSSAAVTFTARQATDAGTVVTATADGVKNDLGGSDLTTVISSSALGTRSESDITIIPSVHTTMDFEHMLLKG